MSPVALEEKENWHIWCYNSGYLSHSATLREQFFLTTIGKGDSNLSSLQRKNRIVPLSLKALGKNKGAVSMGM